MMVFLLGTAKKIEVNAERRYSILYSIICMVIAVFLIAGLRTETAYAASGLKIYDYTTKKQTTYTDKQIKVTLDGYTISNSKMPGILVN